jgi:Ca2+-binding RTX toxin-like protein
MSHAVKSILLPLVAGAAAFGAAATADAAISTYESAGGQVVVVGTSADDAVVVSISGSLHVYSVTLSKAVSCTKDWANGVTTTVASTIATYDASDVTSVAFVGLDGNDYFRNDTGLPGYLYGGAGIDVLIGSSDQDFIKGDYEDAVTPAASASCNVIYGNGGDDYLAGGLLSTSAGNAWQYIYGGDGNDHIGLGSMTGGDSTDMSSNRLYAEGNNGDDFIYGGTNGDTIYGGDGDDLIDGGKGDDAISAGSGDDTVDGGEGEDSINGDDGNDVITGGDGADTLNGGNGADELSGDAGSDTISGGGDNDYLYGGDDDDDLYGESGRDHIYGEGGNDYMSGGSGNDDLFGGDGGTDNYCKGGTGNDSFHDCNYALGDW